MTYAKPDPLTMTAAELADYHRRCGTPDDQPDGIDPAQHSRGHGFTVPVPFEDGEIARVRERSDAAGEDVVTWVHEAAVREAGVVNPSSGSDLANQSR